MAGGNNDELASGLSGNGGSAILTSGVVSVDSSTAQVDGGSGNVGYGYAGVTEGSGGNASVSFESLNLTSNRHGVSSSIGVISNFTVVGGAGPPIPLRELAAMVETRCWRLRERYRWIRVP